jgi:hypothetical protein
METQSKSQVRTVVQKASDKLHWRGCFVVVIVSTYGPHSSPCTGLDRPLGFHEVEMVSLSALRTGRLYSHEIFLVLITVRGHSAVGKIKSMKNSSHTIGYRTRGVLVAQCLNQLRYRVPSYTRQNTYIKLVTSDVATSVHKVLFIEKHI